LVADLFPSSVDQDQLLSLVEEAKSGYSPERVISKTHDFWWIDGLMLFTLSWELSILFDSRED